MKRTAKILLTLISLLLLLSAVCAVAIAAEPEGEKVTVRFLDEDGALITTVTAEPGETVAFPEGASKTVVDGWVGYVPLEWRESLTVPSGVSEYNITAKAGGEGKYVADVDLLFNISLASHMQYNLYIPETKEGIEVTKVLLKDDRTANYKSNINKFYTVNGKRYNCTSIWPGMINSVNYVNTVSVEFNYKGESFTASSGINAPKYCQYVLENDYGDSAKALAANVANYLYEGAIMMSNGTAQGIMRPIVEAYSDRVILPRAEELTLPDTKEMSRYVSSVQVVVNALGPKFRFNLTEEGKAATVTLSTGTSTSNYKTLGYIETNNTFVNLINSTVITVKPASGATVSLKYTLANYIAATSLDSDGKVIVGSEKLYSFLAAMYGYSRAIYIPDTENHNFDALTVAPTCSHRGYTLYTCRDCDYFYTANFTKSSGGLHKITSYEAKEATCTEDGWYAYEACENCSYTTYKEIKASHKYSTTVKAPVCVEGGYTEYSCSVCGHSYTGDYLDPTGHTMGEWYYETPISAESDGVIRSSCLNCAHYETKTPTVIASGNFGKGNTPTASVQYKLFEEGTLKIFGEGATFGSGWNGANQPFYAYRSSIKSLIICEGVTGTSGGDFAGLSNLESISFPSTFSYVGTNAFMDTFKKGITKLTIPESVTYLGTYAFGYYSVPSAVFTEIIIENPDVEFYTNPANTANELRIFNRGYYNSDIIFYSYGVSNNVSAYAEKIGATYVNLNDTVAGVVGNLSYEYFDGELKLYAEDPSSEAILPEEMPWLDRIDRSLVTDLIIGDGIKSIPDSYFADYTALKSVELSRSVTAIGSEAFSVSGECDTPLTVNLPEKLSTLGSSVFKNRLGVTANGFAGSAADSLSEAGVTVNLKKVFRLLLLGNSLSLDASDNTSGGTESMLYDIIKSMLGENSYVEIGTLYSGARTCAWHATMARDEVAAYQFSVISDDTNGLWRVISSASTSRFGFDYADWDIVTVQPYGNETLTGVDDTTTGITNSYKDECFLSLSDSLPFILDCIAESCPDAEVYYYLTWASSTSAYLNTGLSKYQGMVDVAVAAVQNSGDNKSFTGIIPVGTAIQNARSTYLSLLYSADSIDPQRNLQRDAVHLSLTVGRYIAALTFAEILVPESMRADGYTLPSIKDSDTVGKLPGEYTYLARLAVAEAVASSKLEGAEKYMPVSISGYTVDPSTTHAAAVSAMNFASIKASDKTALVEEIVKIAKTGAKEDIKITAELVGDPALSASDTAFTAKVTVSYGYMSVTVDISGTAHK